MISQEAFEIYKTPNLQSPSLIVSWSQDVGQLGSRVVDYLNKKLAAEELGDIKPVPFFSFGGVRIEDDVIHFPESKFYSCERNDLLIFKSSPPSYEQYKFLNSVIDFAQDYCKVKEFYTLGGIVSSMAHTSPRRILTVVNQSELKEVLRKYGLETNMEFETPRGGRPTLSSFLLWVAKRRNLAGVNLLTEVPFYLAAVEDLRAIRYTLWFLDKRFALGVDFGELDLEIEKQNVRIEQLRGQNLEVSKFIEMLESGIALSEEENEKLAKEVTEFLAERD